MAPKPEAFFLEPETNYPNPEAKYFSPELIYPGPEAVSLNPETKYPSPEANYPESDAIYLNPETMYLSAEANYHRAEGLYPGHVPFYLRDIARCPGKTSRRRTNAPTWWCTTVGQAVPAPRMQGPTVPLTRAVVEQALRYTLTLKAPYLAVSNGMAVFCCKISEEGMERVEHLPTTG